MKIGILGGGQLGAMLASAAIKLGITPLVFTDDDASPASHTSASIQIGKIADHQALTRFLASAPVIVFENEFIDCESLRKASRGLNCKFVPSLEVIEELQDKLKQKHLMTRIGLPTASYREVATAREALQAFPQGCVLKWSRQGYDGKGVFFLSPAQAMKDVEAFFAAARERGAVVYAEEKIAFKRELALVSVHAEDGASLSWPLAISEQDHGVCRRVYGPAAACGVAAALEPQARQLAKTLAEALKLTGVFALELFETTDGRLLVNEIAPRVHNSGHYTMDGAATSQFENHVRAAFNQTLGGTDSPGGFAMLNLLGPPDIRLKDAQKLGPRPSPGLKVHWYSKSEIKPGRKLGHINATGASEAAGIQALLGKLEKCHNEWVDQLQKLSAGESTNG